MEQGKVDYETVMELLKLTIREPIMKKILLAFFTSKYTQPANRLMSAKLPAIELK